LKGKSSLRATRTRARVICEAAFMGANKFPPPSIRGVAEDRHRELAGEGFGYQLLPFEHGSRDGDDDVGFTR
jgi:hypothetical protein